MKNIFKPFDFLFILASLSAVVFSFLMLRNGNSEKEARLIIDGGGKEFVYPLSENLELNIEGEIGISVIKIENGKAFFEDSPCPNRLCVEMAPVKENNDWAACMPNEVFIRVEK